MSTDSQYLKTLNRIPDDIVLSMATRGIVPEDAQSCVCGWAIREAVVIASDLDASQIGATFFPEVRCRDMFGGSQREWNALYRDIAHPVRGSRVERAFVRRVKAAAGVAR